MSDMVHELRKGMEKVTEKVSLKLIQKQHCLKLYFESNKMVNNILQFAVWFAWNCGAMPCNLNKKGGSLSLYVTQKSPN